MTSDFGNDIILSLWHQTATTPTLVPTAMVLTRHSSDIHLPVSSWRFWVYYEIKRTVIKFWIC